MRHLIEHVEAIARKKQREVFGNVAYTAANHRLDECQGHRPDLTFSPLGSLEVTELINADFPGQ